MKLYYRDEFLTGYFRDEYFTRIKRGDSDTQALVAAISAAETLGRSRLAPIEAWQILASSNTMEVLIIGGGTK